jgi:hypothetical protein
MLILKYFATVGTVLTVAVLALSAYLEPSKSDAPARMPGSTTTASLFVAAPKSQPQAISDPGVSQPKVAAAPASTHSSHHRPRVR